MAFTKLEEWDETPINNTEMNGIDLQENVMRPPAVNNEMREHMAQVAKWLGADTLASASTTDLGSVAGRYVYITGTTTITAFGTIKEGTIKYVKFSGALTLTHNATSLILQGGANRAIQAGDTGIYVSEGSGNWREIAFQRAAGEKPINGTAQTASGTAVNFTSIPSWVKTITMTGVGVSMDGTADYLIQIGDSGGYEATGYSGGVVSVVGSGVTAFSTAFQISRGYDAALVANFTAILTLTDAATNTWSFTCNTATTTAVVNVSAGSKALSATLDRIRLVNDASPAKNFDAGTVNIQYS